jgi:hypothetical protein
VEGNNMHTPPARGIAPQIRPFPRHLTTEHPQRGLFIGVGVTHYDNGYSTLPQAILDANLLADA